MPTPAICATLEDDAPRWGWTWSVLLDVFDDAIPEVNAIANGRDDIAGWALITDVGTQVDGIPSRAMSFDVLGGSVPLTLREGRLPVSPDEAVLGAGLARQTDGAVGEIIRVASPTGDLPITVVGIATLYPNETEQLASPSVLLTTEGLERVVVSESFVSVAVRAAEGITPEVLYSRLAEVIGADRMTPTSYALADPPMEIAHITQLRPVPLALAVFFGALALTLVGNALLMTPRRRAAELAVLRALGLRPGQAASTVRWQALTIASISLAIGLPLGLIAARVRVRPTRAGRAGRSWTADDAVPGRRDSCRLDGDHAPAGDLAGSPGRRSASCKDASDRVGAPPGTCPVLTPPLCTPAC